MTRILTKIIAVSFIMVIIASSSYYFLTDTNINFVPVYEEYDVLNFGSYADFNTYLQTNYDSYTNNYLSPELSLPTGVRTETSDSMTDDMKGSSESDNDYSETNIQELGVDEPDIVKTDGTYLYVISNLNLYIIYAYPSENAEIVSKIKFNESERPNNLFINDDKMAVICQSYIYRYYGGFDEDVVDEEKIWEDTTKTHVFIYDLSEIDKPTKINTIEIEGYYSNARMIDDFVYVITTQYAYEPILYMDEGSTYIPKISVNENEEKIGLNDIYYINSPDVSKTMTNIISFNIKESTNVNAEVFILGTPSTIYVSSNNIYITSISDNYDYDTLYDLMIDYVLPYLPDEAQDELNNVNSLSVEDYQKITISEWIIQNYVEKMDEKQKQNIARQLIMQFEKTIIHKINIDNGEITYDSQGTVPGYVRNQFSISEYNNNLRVATTVNGWMMRPYISSIESYNNLYVFNENLEIIGYIEDIAIGEEIYSVRFLEEKCYLVTYKQIDPFFVIDLKDPENPVILGELKIPGYSTYLHPYDENNVIGIGQEGSNVKISLFDVEDVSNPKELSTYQIQKDTEDFYWSYSTALYEHKAFLFDKSKNLLILPISTDYKESAYVFNVTNNDISLKGIITHSNESIDEDEHEPWESYYWKGDYGYSIKRSLFIENVIYTISDSMIKMNDMETLNEINSINLD